MKKHLLFSLSVVVALGVSSCGDKEEPISAAQAKEIVTNMGSQMAGDITDLVNAKGLQGVQDLAELMEAPEFDLPSSAVQAKTLPRKAIFKMKAKNRAYRFKAMFVPKTLRNSRQLESGFDFAANKGVYEYNAEHADKFVKVGESSMIVFKFPSKGSTTNDSELKLVEYAEVVVQVTGTEYVYNEETMQYEYVDYVRDEHIPTSIKADLHIGGEKYVDLNYTGSFFENGEPKIIDGSLFILPFTYALNFNNSVDNIINGSTSLSNNGTQIVSAGGTLTFEDYATNDGGWDMRVKEGSEVAKVEPFVSYRDMKLEGSIDAKGMHQAQGGENEVDINSFVKMTLSRGSQVVGTSHIEVTTETVKENWGGQEYEYTKTSTQVYIVLTDGSKEKLEDFFAPTIVELEKALEKAETNL